MKPTIGYAACTISVLLILVSASSGQGPAIGTPAFGSFGGGPFDVVNMGNLNVHFTIPILHKAGRGMPFAYDLNYDSSIWYPGSVNGVPTWQPVYPSYWGWQGLGVGAASNVTYTTIYTSGNCGPTGQNTWQAWQYSNLVYTDQSGAHKFGYGSSFIQTNGTLSCPTPGPSPSTPFLASSYDGSGYTAYVLPPTAGSISASVNNPHGIEFGLGATYGGTDANGNEITSSGGVYTDTLGQTALTVAGVPPSNTTLTYTAPSGPAAYTVSYKSYTVKTNFGCSGIAEYNIGGIYLIDKITLPDTTFYQFQYEQTAGGTSSQVTGRLASVTLPTGGSITYAYAMNGTHNGINCTDGSAPIASGSNPSLTRTLSPGGNWLYARTQGSGAHWQTKITDPTSAANQTVIDLQQDAGTGATGNFFPTETQVYAGTAGGTPLKTTITCYNGVSLSTPTSCPTTAVYGPISRQTVFSYLPNLSSTSAESETDTQYYGSVAGFSAEVDTYDYAKGAVGPILNKVITAYSTIGNQILPSSVTVEDAGSNIKALTSYSYDQWTPATSVGTPNHISVPATRGNLTTIATQANSGTTLYRKITYYDTGMPNVVTDLGTTTSGGPNTSTYYYSDATSTCGNAFPTSISEPSSLSRLFTWNCVGGVLLTATDENNDTVTSDYTSDTSFWRPDYTLDQLFFKTTYAYSGQTATESNLNFNGGSSVSDQRTTLDSFGRPILSQRAETPSLANYDTTETDYNVSGQVSRSTLPFQAAAGVTSSSAPGVTTVYDASGRPATSTDSGGGTVAYTPLNNDVLQVVGPAPTGENVKQKQMEYDGLGRLASVCEITSAAGSGTCGQMNSKTGFWTEYTYDALGDLLTVTQNAQATSQTRTYTYDMLGRLTSETNPETGTSAIAYSYDSLSSDPSCGSYTSAGDLVKKVDAMGNVSCFKYDTWHNLAQITYPTGTYHAGTPTKCYVYLDTAVNGKAMLNANTRLAEAYTSSVTSCTGSSKIVDEGFSYSARGQMTDVYESTPDSNGYYHVNATYWANGTLHVLNGGTSPLPGLPAITYGGLDGEGRVATVGAATGQNPVTAVSYNVASQVTGVTLGSLDNDAYQFDPNTNRTTQYKFNMGTGPSSQTGALTWNANGTMKKLVLTDQINSANSQTCNYGYDDLARITSANCGSVWAQTFSFDPFGNLSKSGSASFQPVYTGTAGTGTSPTNQYFQISGGASGVSNYFDANGNLTNDVTNTYTWDAEGNMLSVDGSTVMIYDALGRMIEQTRGSDHTEIVYGPYGLKLALMKTQTLAAAFVKLPGGERAVYNTSGLAYYRHGDNLGSSRLATTSSRTKDYDVAYAPYGEDYDGSGSTADLAFTDQNQDAKNGGWSFNLYDFMFREYRTAHGRWTSPDPAGTGAVDPTNPQTWNRYSYVLNQPLGLVDLLGQCGEVYATTDFQNNLDGNGPQVIGTSLTYGQPCQICPGQGYAVVGGYLICGPPASIATISSQVIGQMSQSGGSGSSGEAQVGPAPQPQTKPPNCANSQPRQSEVETQLESLAELSHVAESAGITLLGAALIVGSPIAAGAACFYSGGLLCVAAIEAAPAGAVGGYFLMKGGANQLRSLWAKKSGC